MDSRFDVIEYLSGLTNFVFDKAVLKRVALRRGISCVEYFEDVDAQTEILCTKDLLLTVLRGPQATASSSSRHGSFEKSFGQQVVTANTIEEIKAQIRQLNRQLGVPEDDGLPMEATVTWVNEFD